MCVTLTSEPTDSTVTTKTATGHILKPVSSTFHHQNINLIISQSFQWLICKMFSTKNSTRISHRPYLSNISGHIQNSTISCDCTTYDGSYCAIFLTVHIFHALGPSIFTEMLIISLLPQNGYCCPMNGVSFTAHTQANSSTVFVCFEFPSTKFLNSVGL
jgi:hypothetical protein